MDASCGRRHGCHVIGRLLLISILAFFTSILSALALPAPGTPAPPLQFTQMLQAPPGARADWEALRGKVVVLEFWATWCEWCVAELPDFNKLATLLDPAKFQFISVDDEDSKVVQNFLAKRKMVGWAAIDTTSGVFKRYGVEFRPTTIIVDKDGRIVAATKPENLTAADLLAVADGKTVKFKPLPVMDKAEMPGAAYPVPTVKPLYEVSLSKAAPDAKSSAMSAGPGEMDMYRWSAEELLSYAYSIQKSRLILTSPLPQGLYNLHAVWTSDDDNGPLIAPFLQPAVTYGLNLQVQPKTVTKKAYVLKATEAGNKLLTPTAMTNESYMSNYWKGKVRIINQSMDGLANALEMGLGAPVVNETRIEGKFDAELEFPANDADAAKTALLKTLGLELIQEDRPIAMFEVSVREASKQSSESKPQPAPKP